MSKKLFAALSLSLLLAACQGSVTTEESAIEGDGGAMMDDTTSSEAMVQDETSSESGTTVEMDVDAGAAMEAQ